MADINTFSGGDDALPSERLICLDIFRGLVLFLLLLGAANWDWQQHFADSHPDSWFAQVVGFQLDHAPWQGVTFWDLIQPAFMFMVGVSMPFSYLSRAHRGERYGDLLTHALIRSLVLIFLGIFLRSMFSESTNWTFEDVLTQIGLGYFVLFFMWRKWWRIQAITVFAVLFLYWLFFVIWKTPMEGFDWAIAAGEGWTAPLTGFEGHWNKNANPAHGFDLWFLNEFSRPEPFMAHEGGYQTLNFVPAFVTMLIGLMAGEFLQEENRGWAIPKLLMFVGVVGILLGVLLDATGICPIVKRIWTPSFVLYSGGWCLLALAILYAVTELYSGWEKVGKPFIILGMNSIAVYVMAWIVAPWLNTMLKIHLSENYTGFFGDALRPFMENVITTVIVGLIAWWMYRRRIFLRI